MWIMSNEIRHDIDYLSNGKWYAAVEDSNEEWVSFTDDTGDLIYVMKRESSVLSGGDWNIRHEDMSTECRFTNSIIEGLNTVIDNNGYLYEEEFLQSLIDKLRSGEYTITHEI
jgi:hypothetical protein